MTLAGELFFRPRSSGLPRPLCGDGPVKLIRPYLIATKEQVLTSSQFGKESTALSTGCPVSPGERRVEAFRQGVESTRSDVALLTVLLYSAIEWLLLVVGCWRLGQGFREVNLSITDVIIFLGLVAFGSVIQRPGVGCQWASAVVVRTE